MPFRRTKSRARGGERSGAVAGAQAMLAAKPNNKFNAKGVCARRNCTRKVSQPHRQFCDACFIPNFKSKRATDKVLANVPQKVRFDTRDRKREQFKKKLAQLNNKRRDMDKEAFLSEAMACIADAWDDDADDGDSAVGITPSFNSSLFSIFGRHFYFHTHI